MIEENEIEIVLESDLIKFPSNTIGIDMGQSLTKFAYLREKNLYLNYFPTQKNDLTIQNSLDSKIDLYPRFNFTGGKSYDLYKTYSKRIKTKLISFFFIY